MSWFDSHTLHPWSPLQNKSQCQCQPHLLAELQEKHGWSREINFLRVSRCHLHLRYLLGSLKKFGTTCSVRSDVQMLDKFNTLFFSICLCRFHNLCKLPMLKSFWIASGRIWNTTSTCKEMQIQIDLHKMLAFQNSIHTEKEHQRLTNKSKINKWTESIRSNRNIKMYHHNHHTTNCIYLDLPEVLQCSNCFHIFSHRLWRVTILYIFCGHRVWSSSRTFSSMRQSGSKATDLGWEEHNMHYMAGSLHSLSMSIHVYPCLPVYLVCFIQPSPTPNPSNKTSLPNLLYPILCICSILILSCLLVSSVIVSIGPSNPYPSISIYIHLYI